MNHPRAPGVDDEILNYFSHLAVAGESFDPTVALEAAPNRVLIEPDRNTGLRDLDFDAVELMNGPSMIHYYRTRADWFSLLLQGEFRTATANSDSHRVGQLLGLPRNYVRLANDDAPGASTRRASYAPFARGGSTEPPDRFSRSVWEMRGWESASAGARAPCVWR